MSRSERRRRAAIGNSRVVPAKSLPPAKAGAGSQSLSWIQPASNRRSLAAIGFLLPFGALAQTAAPALPDGPSLLPLILAFVLVLGLVPVALWVLKRFNGGLPATATGLRVVGQLPLGAQQRIVIVEAGERWLLLGVTGTSISRVGTLPKGVPGTEPIQPASFGALLARFGHDGRNARG